MRDERGFTLIELLVAMSVTVVLMAAVYMAVNSAQRHSSAIERKVTAQQDVKPALNLMAMEIGMASYNPNGITGGLWLNPIDCSAPTDQNYINKGIQEATADSITVEMDITNAPNSSGECTATAGNGSLGDCSEIIRYEYLSGTTDLRITRETIRCASGTRTTGGDQPFLGDTAASGHPRTVRVINNTGGTGNTAIPVFRYYDGTGTEIFPTTADQTPIPNIRRIDITLAAETEHVDPNTNQRRRLIYSTSVIPRNHAISP
jgi:prepilin-type N-terminal cleavage/methylation domain-containing protein